MDGERYSDSLWFKRLLTFSAILARAISDDLIVLVPQSSSLVSGLISASDVENHVLCPTAVKGDFLTLRGNKVHISGSQVIAGEGFPRQIVAKLLSIESASVSVPANQLALIAQAKAKAAAAAAAASESEEPDTKDGGDDEKEEDTTTVASSGSADSGATTGTAMSAASALSTAASARSPIPKPPAPSLSSPSPPFNSGSNSMVAAKLRVYFVSRPLDKGIPAPSGAEDMDHGSILRFVAMLRASPETEAVFHVLDAAADKAAKQLRMAQQSGAASADTSTRDFFFDFVLPPITSALLAACRSAADSLLTTGPCAQRSKPGASGGAGSSSSPFGGGVAGGDSSAASLAATRRQILQILESHVMERLYPTAFPIVEQAVKHQTDELKYVLGKMKGMTQEQLGVKAIFRSPRLESIVGLLGLLNNSVTPLEKLHCFRDTTMTMMRCIESELEKKTKTSNGSSLDLADVDLATDDILDILLWVIVEGGSSEDHATWKLPAHLEYAQAFHFVSDDLAAGAFAGMMGGGGGVSRLEYFAGNFWQALGYFEGKADMWKAKEKEELAAAEKAKAGPASTSVAPS